MKNQNYKFDNKLITLICLHNELIRDGLDKHHCENLYDIIYSILYDAGYSTYEQDEVLRELLTYNKSPCLNANETLMDYLSMFTPFFGDTFKANFTLVNPDVNLIQQLLVNAKKTEIPAINSLYSSVSEIVVDNKIVLMNMLKVGIIQPRINFNHEKNGAPFN